MALTDMQNKLKVVLNTNIFIYGWFADNIYCDKILELVDDRKLQLLFAQDTIGELVYITKNFVRHNLGTHEEKIAALNIIMELFYYATSVNTLNMQCSLSKDTSDDMFLKCAIKGEADYFITDDFKHGMHDNEQIKNVKVVSSEEFTKIYEELGL